MFTNVNWSLEVSVASEWIDEWTVIRSKIVVFFLMHPPPIVDQSQRQVSLSFPPQHIPLSEAG